ncbi:hypothetical protein PAXRUDRAFT_15653 [Paxillus rubicundulus Ve08.2h10]|uniref:DDE-1 domain-containing protein n=1 Tax=Paxillus rubicundulus Ve08.2h10 TaxID=930991 RepID=A0A0D0DP85_9AGAM|nr:hypothetical protein PAXRUDRAFT_15653 [Paxillus rubicundulus Ve08.2h10]
MLAMIQNCIPKLLTTFKCSEKFVWTFFDSVLNWSPQKGTHTAVKLPADTKAKCEECFFHLVYIIKWYSVPPKLVVGFDQIGNYVLSSSGTTFAERGSHQVDIVTKDEKHAYTLLVASMPEGTFLPFQQVWGGSSPQSLPSVHAQGMDEAQANGFDFTFAKSNKRGSHFSTLKTMKEWVEHIFKPYCCYVIEVDPDLDDNQILIVYLNCYPVHMSQEFCSYIFNEYLHVILCFVPASCTGIFQPADVGLNHIIKHHLKQHQTEYLVDLHQKQMDSGLTAEQVKFTTSLPVLRDASVAGIMAVYDFMMGQFGCELVQKSWEHCQVKDWNLSAKCLTNKAAQMALNEYLRSHHILHDEIENQMGIVHGVKQVQLNTAEADDDADVPSSAVIQDALGLDVQVDIPVDIDVISHCVESTEKGPDNTLVAAGEDEDIWAYINFN